MTRDVALWTSILAGPVIWAASFEARYALVSWTCTSGHKSVLFVVTLATVLLCGASAALGWSVRHRLAAASPSMDAADESRPSFMALMGVVISLLAALVTVAQSIPEMLLGACQ